MLSGYPTRLKVDIRASATFSASMEVSAMASGYLVARSTRVKIYLFPDLVLCSGPIMSTATHRNGSPITVSGTSSARSRVSRRANFWHTEQTRQCSATSAKIPGHQKWRRIRWAVFAWPMWPAMGTACASCNTVRRRWAGRTS